MDINKKKVDIRFEIMDIVCTECTSTNVREQLPV